VVFHREKTQKKKKKKNLHKRVGTIDFVEKKWKYVAQRVRGKADRGEKDRGSNALRASGRKRVWTGVKRCGL